MVAPILLAEAEKHIDDFGLFLNRQFLNPDNFDPATDNLKKTNHKLVVQAMNNPGALENFTLAMHLPDFGLRACPTTIIQMKDDLRKQATDLKSLFYRTSIYLNDIFKSCYYSYLDDSILQRLVNSGGRGQDGILGGFYNFMRNLFSMVVTILRLTEDERPKDKSQLAWKQYGDKVSKILKNSYNLLRNSSMMHMNLAVKFLEMNLISLRSFNSSFYPLSSSYYQITGSEGSRELKVSPKMIMDLHNETVTHPIVIGFGSKAHPMFTADALGCPVLEVFTPSIGVEWQTGNIGGEELGKECFDWVCDLLDATIFKHLDEFIDIIPKEN